MSVNTMAHPSCDDMESDSHSPLSRFLILLSEPEDLGVARLRGDPECFESLLSICQFLYQRLEQLNSLHCKIQHREVKPLSQSALPRLIVGDEGEAIGDPSSLQYFSVETIWSQINFLQSSKFQSLLKKSIKDLGKAANSIQLLAPEISGESVSPGEFDDGLSDDASHRDNMKTEEQTGETANLQDKVVHFDSWHDSDSDDGQHSMSSMGNPVKRTTGVKFEHKDTYGESERNGEVSDGDSDLDPAVQQLNDGIFDFHEMEAFADEEEAYLPDPAFGTEKTDLEQSEGADVEGESSGDEATDELTRRANFVRRRMYREEEDIEALYQLYKTSQPDSYDVSAAELTASDLYGDPNPIYFHKWRKERTKCNGPATHDSGNVRKGSEDVTSWRKESNCFRGGFQDDRGSLGKQDSYSGERRARDKLSRQTELLEQEMLAEKPWQMKGEMTSMGRPVNSLLGATPDFEVATKLAPVVTIEHTESIEEMIKGRVLNEDWDDLIPRELPDIGWSSKRGELVDVSQEKSKLSLGDLYEREYLKKAVGYDVDAVEKESELDKAKSEMKTLFANLCSKLDALSNYHFAPRPIAEEPEVRVLTKPAIAMEETLPIHVNESRVSAPQDVYSNKRGREGILRNESELDQIDRKRMRSAKKAARRKSRQEKLADEKLLRRIQPGLGLNNPYEKRKARQDLEAARAKGRVTSGEADKNQDYGDSGTFFKRLQNEAQRAVRDDGRDVARSTTMPSKTSASLKL